jgi:predicted GIY-YIG superfamily endonuclease
MQVTWLYVLRLQKDNYYVGTTTDLTRRFDEHWDGDGAAWTTKYSPIEVISVSRDKTLFDENSKVKELMSIHGINKVRGGSYSNYELTSEQINMIEYELKHVRGKCFNCGSSDHWVKDCVKCSRCGRDNHVRKDCYAKVHVDGTKLELSANDLTIEQLKLILDEKNMSYVVGQPKGYYVSLVEKLL